MTAALHAAMVEADMRHSLHWSACRPRKEGWPCLTLDQLEEDALNKADRYEAARRREAVLS